MKRKILSLFLALALVLSMMPAMSVTAFADDETVTFDFASGNDLTNASITPGEGNARSINVTTKEPVTLNISSAGSESLSMEIKYIDYQQTIYCLFIPDGNNEVTISCKKGYSITKVEYHVPNSVGYYLGFQSIFSPGYNYMGLFDVPGTPGTKADPYSLTVIGDSSTSLDEMTEDNKEGIETYTAPEDSVVTEVKLSDNAPDSMYINSIKVTVKCLLPTNVTYSANANTITANYTDYKEESKSSTIKLTAINLPFTGMPYTGATLDKEAWEKAYLEVPTIRYKGRQGTNYSESSTAPTTVGKYTAYITVAGNTASADFEITSTFGSNILSSISTIFKSILTMKAVSLISKKVLKLFFGFLPWL